MEEKTEFIDIIRYQKGIGMMLCERCNKKKSTVFYRENIGGRIKTLRLCGECAEILEQAGELEEISSAVAGWISPFFLADDLFNLPFHSFNHQTSETETASLRSCPVCRATVEDIVKSGKVGCSTCYNVFAKELASAIRSSHGNTIHTGRTSSGYRRRMETIERLAGLKKQLKEAVAGEKYEVAVGLRDEIRSLEATL